MEGCSRKPRPLRVGHSQRSEAPARLLHEGWKDVAKVFLVAIVMDFVYQIIELRWFYPEEAVIVATLLALLPYLLLRGPANRIARYWQHAEEPR